MSSNGLLVILVLVLPLFTSSISAQSSPFLANSPIIPTSILLAGVPECTLTCGAPLLAAIARAYQFPSNAIFAFNTVCSEYQLALSCVKDSGVAECQSPNYFDIITSGLKFACQDFRIDFNDLYTVLGSRQPGINQECSNECKIANIAQAFANVTAEGPDALTRSVQDPENVLRQALLTADLDILCTGVKCVLDCSSAKIDAIVPGFGEVFQKLDRLPWEVTGVHLQQIRSAPLRLFFKTVVPKSCWALMQPVQIFESSGDLETSGEASGVDTSGNGN